MSKHLKTHLRSISSECFLALANHIIKKFITFLTSKCYTTFLENAFFSYVIEWNDLDLKIKNSENFSTFEKCILKFIRPSSKPIFNCHSPNGIKLITGLRLGLSHLCEHKLGHCFLDTFDQIGSCGDDIETIIHYLLHCPNSVERTLLHNLQHIGEDIHDKNDFEVSELLLFGVSSNNDASNTFTLNATIRYIWASKRFVSLLVTSELFERFTVLNTMLTLLSPKIAHTRFNKSLFVSFLSLSLMTSF